MRTITTVFLLAALSSSVWAQGAVKRWTYTEGEQHEYRLHMTQEQTVSLPQEAGGPQVTEFSIDMRIATRVQRVDFLGNAWVEMRFEDLSMDMPNFPGGRVQAEAPASPDEDIDRMLDDLFGPAAGDETDPTTGEEAAGQGDDEGEEVEEAPEGENPAAQALDMFGFEGLRYVGVISPRGRVLAMHTDIMPLLKNLPAANFPPVAKLLVQIAADIFTNLSVLGSSSQAQSGSFFIHPLPWGGLRENTVTVLGPSPLNTVIGPRVTGSHEVGAFDDDGSVVLHAEQSVGFGPLMKLVYEDFAVRQEIHTEVDLKSGFYRSMEMTQTVNGTMSLQKVGALVGGFAGLSAVAQALSQGQSDPQVLAEVFAKAQAQVRQSMPAEDMVLDQKVHSVLTDESVVDDLDENEDQDEGSEDGAD